MKRGVGAISISSGPFLFHAHKFCDPSPPALIAPHIHEEASLMHKLTDEQQKVLRALKTALDAVRADDDKLQVYELQALLEVVCRPEDAPASRKDLDRAIWPLREQDGMNSNLTRLLDHLSEWEKQPAKGREGRRGLNYMAIATDPLDRRSRLSTPTAKGLERARQLADAILRAIR
ncbi:MAG: hypothetical protein B7Y08_18620 [Rhodospirillales bacterium 24-66-33]|nr:MAG: hypothetical protein B7Y57_17370 [Rhodospirillales bacterium 35-66-84]OYZ93095.1 MAG: hypothetical protein B7Y08_18620 [Rhodospirillales bacterium 24-66-33]OZB24223.1 MAG: hypothetical protein B7X63_16580 [Rhodospirillales bacterium 39-66-50]